MDVPVETRPVRPDDGPLFCRLWDRLSPETVYRRFHAPLRSPPLGAHRLVEVDHDLREALVAVVGGEVVGVARYDRSPGAWYGTRRRMPCSTSVFSRSVSTALGAPSTRWKSANRRTPRNASRSTSRLHFSPTTASAPATEHRDRSHWASLTTPA